MKLPGLEREDKDRPGVEFMSPEKFKRILKGPETFQLYHIAQQSQNKISTTDYESSDEEKMILKEYQDVFCDDNSEDLAPKRKVDYVIETDPSEKPLHRPHFYLCPSQLQETKKYVSALLEKIKIRPSRSPYGTPLFFLPTKKTGWGES